MRFDVVIPAFLLGDAASHRDLKIKKILPDWEMYPERNGKWKVRVSLEMSSSKAF